MDSEWTGRGNASLSTFLRRTFLVEDEASEGRDMGVCSPILPVCNWVLLESEREGLKGGLVACGVDDRNQKSQSRNRAPKVGGTK
jgi:hypothetical protein